MIVFVHQPEYIPWLGFFDKLARCDVFVIYDDAQYQHGAFHNRNRIRTPEGWRWLTVPIVHGHPQKIKDVKISGKEWTKKQLDAICRNYQGAPFFREYHGVLQEAFELSHESLISLNIHLIDAIAKILDINANMVRSSECPYLGQEKNEKLVSICKYIGADTYLSGSGGKNYVNEALFAESNIKVQWHQYEHPIYPQAFAGFQPNMSILDLLFNQGSKAKQTLLSGGILTSTGQSSAAALAQTVIA